MNNFTPLVQEVLESARKNAAYLGHHSVGITHLLHEIASSASGVGVHILQQLGYKENILTSIAAESPCLDDKSRDDPGNIQYHYRVQIALVWASKSCRELGHGTITTGHLLVAILSFMDGKVFDIAKKLGLTVEMVTHKVKEIESAGMTEEYEQASVESFDLFSHMGIISDSQH